MNQRREIIERLQALKLEGGSHQMLSDICRAVAPGAQFGFGWTQGACDGLRLRLISFLSETDEEALREAYTKGREDGMGMANAKDAHAEYLRGKNDGYDEGYDAGFASADDWLGQHEDAMAEHGWVKLPKDADGEYIHIGDVMESGDGDAFIVSSVDYGLHSSYGCGKFWMLWNEDADFYERAYECRHHKQPTVEDTLREFALEIDGAADVDFSGSVTIAKYAKLLRLAGSDAE